MGSLLAWAATSSASPPTTRTMPPSTTTVTASSCTSAARRSTNANAPVMMTPSTEAPVPSAQANIVRLATLRTHTRSGKPSCSTRRATGRRTRSESRYVRQVVVQPASATTRKIDSARSQE